MRSFRSGYTEEQLRSIQEGTLKKFKYRGVPCLKNPVDFAIYSKLIWDVKPGTLFEIGTKYGGSALYFSDLCSSYGFGTQIVSIDLSLPEKSIPGVKFLEGDANELEAVFEMYGLFTLPRPWLVIEDSAHTYETCSKVLAFFAGTLVSGEILVMEDGILVEQGLEEKYDGGPNRAIRSFFAKHQDVYEIEFEYCDMFGTNLTYNPNGFLRKI